jgi:regulator of sigma E protease
MSAVLVVVAIVALATLIVLHEGGHFLVARLCGMRVERFSLGFGNPLVSFKRGDTIYQIAPIPLGGFVQITGLNPHEDYDRKDPYVYPNRPRWMRLAVLVAGPAANYVAACFMAFFLFGVFGMPESVNAVNRTVPGAPADKAGLKAGDELLEANGRALSSKLMINEVITESNGQPVALKLLRNGQPMNLTVTPAQENPKAPYRIGIELQQRNERSPLHTAAVKALILPATESVKMLKSIGDMLTGKQRPDLQGPVGITRLLVKTAYEGPKVFLYVVMMLSIYLGLFNLLPFPALDGGRVLFLGINALRSKDMNEKTEAAFHMVGLALLLGLFVIVTFSDIKSWVMSIFNKA